MWLTNLSIRFSLLSLAVQVSVRVISARHLPKASRGTTSPLVEVECCGMETDHGRFKTVTVSDNGLRPTFNLAALFEIGLQDVASLRFMVSDEDMFGDANIIAQNCYPLGSHDNLAIRTGR